MSGLDKYLRYIPDKEPALLGGPLLAALLIAVIVEGGARLGITFTETELPLIGLGCLFAAGAIVRRFTTSGANPNLPIGTVVNATSSAPTAVVVDVADPRLQPVNISAETAPSSSSSPSRSFSGR